jgi:hypothetical protein
MHEQETPRAVERPHQTVREKGGGGVQSCSLLWFPPLINSGSHSPCPQGIRGCTPSIWHRMSGKSTHQSPLEGGRICCPQASRCNLSPRHFSGRARPLTSHRIRIVPSSEHHIHEGRHESRRGGIWIQREQLMRELEIGIEGGRSVA